MVIKNVMIAGGGTLGSQIAWQTAFHGFNVTVYDVMEKGLEVCKGFHQQYAELFMAQRGATQQQIDETFARLSYTTSLEEAAKDADIVSESVPENIQIKKSFYTELSGVAPEKTIFTTNSSTMLPSDIVDVVNRPEKFLALHFANGIWDANIGEVMGHPGTDKKYFNEVVEFARAIGMVPIIINKEQNGYIINALMVPLMQNAIDLYMKGVSDYENIDKTWMISTGMPYGIFGIIDIIGIETIYHIDIAWGERNNDTAAIARAEWLKENYIDKNKIGIKTGVGFYEYPNPEYQNPDFLK
jgi:3-hydroxyacyl-CoA dehydrogenase